MKRTQPRARPPRPPMRTPHPPNGGVGRAFIVGAVVSLLLLTAISLVVGWRYHSWGAGCVTGFALGTAWTLIVARRFR